MKMFLTWATASLMAFSAQGSLLKYGPTQERLAGVDLYESAIYEADGEKLHLQHLGAGIRKKRVIVNLKIYVAQLMSSDKEAFVQDRALESIDKMDAMAIRLQFLRSVGMPKIKAAYTNALVKNGVDVNSEQILTLLDAISGAGEGVKGKEFVFLGLRREDGREIIIHQGTNGKIFNIEGKPGFIREVFSMWLGKPSDKGIRKLKKQLLGG